MVLARLKGNIVNPIAMRLLIIVDIITIRLNDCSETLIIIVKHDYHKI